MDLTTSSPLVEVTCKFANGEEVVFKVDLEGPKAHLYVDSAHGKTNDATITFPVRYMERK